MTKSEQSHLKSECFLKFHSSQRVQPMEQQKQMQYLKRFNVRKSQEYKSETDTNIYFSFGRLCMAIYINGI